MQVHQQSGALGGALGVALLPLARVHKLLGEAVAVVEVVAAAAPQPVPGKVLGPRRPAAAAARQLPLPAGPADRIDHARRTDGVGERRLAAPCGHTRTEDDMVNVGCERDNACDNRLYGEGRYI